MKNIILYTLGLTGLGIFALYALNKKSTSDTSSDEDAISTILDESISEENVAADSVREKEIDVSRHIRNLSAGCNASPEKIALAAENGFELGENQTWVMAYIKYIFK